MRILSLRQLLLMILSMSSVLLVPAWANPGLPHLISDHAVFQQEQQIKVWGTADAGEDLTVSLAAKTAITRADASGHWHLELPPMKAGGPFTLRISGKTTLLVKDVLIGEVWVASGQSNMTFALGDSEGAADELPKADYPEIRLFAVPRRVSLSAQGDTLPASWSACTTATAKEFSAVAYYFARELHRKLHVPIGVIESAWPGTAIEEWMPPGAVQTDPKIKSMLDDWDRREPPGLAEPQEFDLQFDDFELLPGPASKGIPVSLSNFDDRTARNSFGGYWAYDAKEAPETLFELSSPGRLGKGFAAQVGGKIDAADDSRLLMRFYDDLQPADLSAYSGVRFWVRGNGSFRFRTLQPTISDWDDYSSDLFQASDNWTPVTIWFRDLRQEGWGVTQNFTPQSLTGISIECLPPSGYPKRPASAIYNGMIAPLVSNSFRGAIWYQGEGNALRAHAYQRLLPAMIDGWRAESHQPDLQFLIVQLPNHGAVPDQPSESAWAELREAQFMAASRVHDVGLAVTIDLGAPLDLHPHRKREVGERLALWALGKIYGEPMVYSGPVYESMSVAGAAIRVRFSNVGGGLIAKGSNLRGFAVAGQDHKFYWASASIAGDSVVVSSPRVPNPVAVRYAWGDSPVCNLFNAEGLPASPFRTDDWPGITGSK